MRPTRLSVAASLLSAAVIGAAVSGLAPVTPAFAGVPTSTPTRYALPGTDSATDILGVGQDVWISAGNTVLLATRDGPVKRTVTGVFGANGLTAAPDGRSVYVSASTTSKIFQLSTAGDVLDIGHTAGDGGPVPGQPRHLGCGARRPGGRARLELSHFASSFATERRRPSRTRPPVPLQRLQRRQFLPDGEQSLPFPSLFSRRLIEHGFDPTAPGCEFDVLRAQI